MTGFSRLRRSAFAATALLPFLTVPAFAQDADDESIIVIGARVPIPESEVTAAVTVLEPAEISLRGPILADATAETVWEHSHTCAARRVDRPRTLIVTRCPTHPVAGPPT